jgi:hypothetical protein
MIVTIMNEGVCMMEWNPWNTSGERISVELTRQQTNTNVTDGLESMGFNFIKEIICGSNAPPSFKNLTPYPSKHYVFSEPAASMCFTDLPKGRMLPLWVFYRC